MNFRLILALVAIAASFSCKPQSVSEVVSAETASAPTDRPLTRAEMPTTAGPLYQSNFDARLASFNAQVKNSKLTFLTCALIASDYRIRGQYSENLPDFVSALDISNRCIEAGIVQPEVYVLRAISFMAIHKFDSAKQDLDTALAKGLDKGKYGFLMQSILWEKGQYAQALPIITGAAQQSPSVTTLTRLAVVLNEEGKREEADQAFAQASTLILDPNPLLLAWLEAQRGGSWLARGKPDVAIPYFEAALDRLPNYKIAVEKLGEAYAAKGDFARAEAQFSKLANGQQPDLGAMIRLMVVYKKTDPSKIPPLAAKVKGMIQALKPKFPEVFFALESELALATGDLATAESAINDEMTKVGAASDVFAKRAQLRSAKGDHAAAVEDINTSLSMPLRSAQLHATAAEVFEKAGDAAKAAEQKAAAEAMNPLIFNESVIIF